MDTAAFQVARARAIALCRAAAEEPIPVEQALAFVRESLAEADSEEEREELQAMELVFQAVGAVQEIGRALAQPAGSVPVVVPRPHVGAVVVPVPPNVR